MEVHPETLERFGNVSLFKEHVFSSGSTIIECIRVCVSLLPLVEIPSRELTYPHIPPLGKENHLQK